MEELRKIKSMQIYYLWRNLAVALVCIGGLIAATMVLPFYMAPVISLFLCGVLYTMMWNNSTTGQNNNMVTVETILFGMLLYTFVSVLLVVIFIFSLANLPHEIIFFNEPFVPSLILMPCCLAATLYAVLFQKSMPAYKRFRNIYGNVRETGYFGLISAKETKLQLRNLLGLFAVLTAVIWWYYLTVYVNINQNGRDWYVFSWTVILLVLFDEVYFMMRYYNLFLDLQEHNEIITPEELRDITAHTFLRYYVICGEYIFINRHAFDRLNQVKDVYDTPFITKRTVNGVPVSEARTIIEKMTGRNDGELRFYFGRHLAGVDKHSLLRYFYFLDGDISDYPDMGKEGEWVHFNEIKNIYKQDPHKFATNALHDLSRLLKIIITERVFDEYGVRKNKIKSYNHSLTLADVRKSKIDFQDDKWIHIAEFNSDTRFFKLKKVLRDLSGRRGMDALHK